MSFKEALKIHGHLQYESCESDSEKSEFDEEYYNLRPPPVDIATLKIVEIRPQVLKTQNYVNKNSSDVGDSNHIGDEYQNFTSLALEMGYKNVQYSNIDKENFVSKTTNYKGDNLQFSPTLNIKGILKKNTLDGNFKTTANRPVITNRSDNVQLTNTLQTTVKNISNKNSLAGNFRTTATTSTVTNRSQNVQPNVRTTANTSIITNRSDNAQLTDTLQTTVNNVSNKNSLAGNFGTTATTSTVTNRSQNVQPIVRTTANTSKITNRSDNAQLTDTLQTTVNNVSNKNSLAGNFGTTASTSTVTNKSQNVQPIVRTTANISIITNRSDNAQLTNTLQNTVENVSNNNSLADNFSTTVSTSTGTNSSQYVKSSNTPESVTNTTEVVIRAPRKQNSFLITDPYDEIKINARREVKTSTPLMTKVKNVEESFCNKCGKWFRCC